MPRFSDRFPSASHFDENGKQTKPMPKKWMDASRFKVGDKIEYLDDTTVHFGCAECKEKSYFHYNNANRERCEDRPMKGIVGVVTEVKNGRGEFPSRWIADDSDDGGSYTGETVGCLYVQFPFSPYKNKDGTFGGVVCHLDGEGRYWRKAKKK